MNNKYKYWEGSWDSFLKEHSNQDTWNTLNKVFDSFSLPTLKKEEKIDVKNIKKEKTYGSI
jgi:hypothetical protein